jgi:SulP family sulfate permease
MTNPSHATPSGLRAYAQNALRDDLVAAFVVAVLLIPQGLAYALLAGLPPEVGIFASLLPAVAYALLGKSSAMSVGPAALLALMTAQGIAVGAALPGATPLGSALVLSLEVGLLLALAAVFKLDALASLLSTPVLQGFSTGSAFALGLSQLPALLGSSAKGSNAPEVMLGWWQSGRVGHMATAAFGLGALAALWLARRHAPALLARRMRPERAALVARCTPLLVIALATAAALAVNAGAQGVALVGELPALALAYTPPPLDPALWTRLLPSAALIALVTFVSHLAVAETLGLQRGEPVDGRRELAGLAAANLVAGVNGGMPVGGSFSRSAVNAEAGARTRWAGVWMALFVALAMWLLAGPLGELPRAVLAATIVIAVMSMVEWRAFAEAWRYSRPEALLMGVVALLTLVEGAHWALAVGVATSIALLLQRTARPHAVVVGRLPGTEHYRNITRYSTEQQPGVIGIRIDESLLFTNSRQLAGVVTDYLLLRPDAQRVLLQMSAVNHIDFSGLEALRNLQQGLAERGIRLDVSEVKGPVLDALKASDWARWYTGQVFTSHHQGVLAA